MEIQNTSFLSIEQLSDKYLTKGTQTTRHQNDVASFREIFASKQAAVQEGELKFSKHAAKRLVDRGIELDDNQLMRLEGGARKAGQKGIVESLVLMDELAFIVNVPSKTVVTAMDSKSEEENIFTNINGAVIV